MTLVRKAEGIAARAPYGSTRESRSWVLSLLGPDGGTVDAVIAWSAETDGVGLAPDWARRNDDLVAAGRVEEKGDSYIPKPHRLDE